jgi:hypothetical protein
MRNSLYLFIFITLISCDSSDNRLNIINNTNHSIFIGVRLWVSDTSEYSKYDRFIDDEFNENQIEPNDTLKMSTKGSWDSSFIENDTIVILVYNRDSIIEKRLKKPSENYDIEQMIYVSHNYVKKNNWKINIDPKKTSKIIKL